MKTPPSNFIIVLCILHLGTNLILWVGTISGIPNVYSFPTFAQQKDYKNVFAAIF